MPSKPFTAVGVPIDCLAFEGPLQAVERMPESLRKFGLIEALAAEDLGDLDVRISCRDRDPETEVIGLADCKAVTAALREKTRALLGAGDRPFFIGGCCTMAVGIAAGMRDHFGETALTYVDGHLDLYDGPTSWQGEMADMPMAIMLGHGPASAMRDVMGSNPIEPRNAFIIGYRDREEAAGRGSLMPEDIGPDLNDLPLEHIRPAGFRTVGQRIARLLEDKDLPFYLHLDLDVLDESLFPATLYHLPQGMNWQELEELLSPLVASRKLAAVSIGCYDPDMDPEERLAGEIVEHVGRIFSAANQTSA